MARVELWEDNAGGLALIAGKRAWTGLAHMPAGQFAEDAASAAKGATDDWTVDRATPAEAREGAWLVATWEDGEVEMIGAPGAAAERYVGATKDGNLNVRATRGQLARWRAAAERDGRTVSNWVTRTLDEAAKRRE